MKKQKSNPLGGIVERKCATCGKRVCRISFVNYAWIIDRKVFCSYGCMRVVERKMRRAR